MRIASLTLVLVVAVALSALHGCGGSSGAKPTPKCVLNSDCRMGSDAGSTLVCALGFCVSPCNDSGDCASGQLCIKSDNGNACRAPEAAKGCVLNSDCTKLCTSAGDDGSVATTTDGGTSSACPIVCGRDQSCRTECATDVDCPGGTLPDGSKGKQKCTVSGACIDPVVDMSIYDPTTNDFKASVTGTAGTNGTAGTTGTAGTAGAAGGTTGTAGSGTAGTTGAAGTTTDGGTDAPATGTAGTTADAGSNPDVALTPDGTVVTPSTKLRQGQQAGLALTVTITKAGTSLSNPTVTDAGGVLVKVDASSTPSSLVLKVSAPHATALGLKTIVVSTSGGNITLTNVVEVTAITAGPTGSDTANSGASDSPLKSLKNALAVADVGDTIHLQDGKYSIATSVESWNYPLPTNITIVGDSTAGTIIDGVGATSNPNGFTVTGTLTLQKLTVQHFNYGIDMPTASTTFTMQDVVLGGNGNYAIYVEQAAMGSTVNVLGAASLIDQPGEGAINVYNVPNVTVNVTDATVQGGTQVIQFNYNVSGGKLNLTGATVKQLSTSYSAVVVGASSNATGTTTTIMNSTIVGNISDSDTKGTLSITGGTTTQKNGDGIDFSGLNLTMSGTALTMNASSIGLSLSGTGSVVKLTNVTIDGGTLATYGVQQSSSGSAVTLRSTTIKGILYDSYYLTAGDLDMGTAASAGDNIILAPSYASGYALYIGRPTGAASGNPVTASGTAIGVAGNFVGAKTVDASGGTVTQATQLWYVSTGNKLVFYDAQ
jgi:hypothetical protein